MGNWKARGVGQMIVTVGCEDVTGDTSSSAARSKGEFDYVSHGLRGGAYDERRWCRVYGRRA
jgi:hypothetical protein